MHWNRPRKPPAVHLCSWQRRRLSSPSGFCIIIILLFSCCSCVFSPPPIYMHYISPMLVCLFGSYYFSLSIFSSSFSYLGLLHILLIQIMLWLVILIQLHSFILLIIHFSFLSSHWHTSDVGWKHRSFTHHVPHYVWILKLFSFSNNYGGIIVFKLFLLV